MLTARGPAAAVVLAVVLAGTSANSALANDDPGGGVVCPPREQDCDVTAQDPGQSGDNKPGGAGKPGSGGGGGKQVCAIDGKTVPCSTPELGTFNSADACYWMVKDPQPDAETARLATGVPDDWKPGDKGKFYNVTCPGEPLKGGLTYSATGPNAAAVDPAQLAQDAVEKMTLLGPEIGITPKPGGKGVVGMPVYLWDTKSAETYGPQSKSASAGAVTVTATAYVTKIVWTMGDGNTVTCTTAGTPYKAAYGKQPSPDCGHRYEQPSSAQSSGKYHVAATSTWTIDWQGGGQTGQLTEIRNSAVDITVAEVQVLNN
ncbi:ATP/GTP-binding protein [Streptomyces mirabilis]|uniref:ATP/GTP-binding protein n=1 Tax=Streptomyces mirabilis TaxID=68239 RepID=UPI003815F9BD